MIHNKENEYRKVLEALPLRFASGNPVPVERSMITRDEYELLKKAVMEANGLYEMGYNDACDDLGNIEAKIDTRVL